MAFCPEHPKWDQNPKFTPLCETTSIPTHFICGVPLPRATVSTELNEHKNSTATYTYLFSLLSCRAKPRMAFKEHSDMKWFVDERPFAGVQVIVHCEVYVRVCLRQMKSFHRIVNLNVAPLSNLVIIIFAFPRGISLLALKTHVRTRGGSGHFWCKEVIYHKIPKISPSMYKPPKAVTEKSLC